MSERPDLDRLRILANEIADDPYGFSQGIISATIKTLLGEMDRALSCRAGDADPATQTEGA